MHACVMEAAAFSRVLLQVLRGRWFMAYASFLVMSAAGSAYVFAIYSKEMKSSLGYDQQTLNTVSFFKDLAANVGLLSGLINEVSPPWVVLALGAAMNLSGYLMVYLAITARIPKPRLWLMCLYICVGASSQAFSNTGALVTCVTNFPESRGAVLGLLKGFVGLSGAIFTQLYLAIYGGGDDSAKSLVLLIAWLPTAISVAFLGIIRVMEIPRQENELRVFHSFLYMSLALAGYLMAAIIVEKTAGFTHPEYIASAIILLLLLLLPLAIVVREEVNLLNNIGKQEPMPCSTSPTAAISTGSAMAIDEQAARPMRWLSCRNGAALRAPGRGEDYSILQAVASVDMIILFVVTMCGVGGALTAVDNMGQIGESLGYSSRSVGTFVSLLSIWNYMGRVAAGFASESLLAKYKFPRPLMLTLVLLLACLGHLLIAFGIFPGSLYAAMVIIGFCLGAQWPLVFAIISEVFGLKHYSTLFNFGAAASPAGAYILNVKVAGYLYDREAEKQNGSTDLACIGVQCFRLAFLIIAAVTLFGALVSLALVRRTSKFYRGDIYARFRHDARRTDSTAAAAAAAGENRDGENLSSTEEMKLSRKNLLTTCP